jgi:hypothetical protein
MTKRQQWIQTHPAPSKAPLIGLVMIYTAMVALVVDMIGFVAWIIANQVPPTGFYLGRITKEIVSLIFGI